MTAKTSTSSRGWANHIKQPANRDVLSGFFKCPANHNLPHRVKGKGRCSPFDCCEAKDGAHGVVRTHNKEAKAESLEYAEATIELAGMKNTMQAWNEAHPVPELPPPPKTSSVREYMEKRMEQVAPLALERRIRKLVLDPGHQGEVAAREMLNRGGYGERPEVRQTFQGPVLIVNVTADQMKAQSPYSSQGKELPHVVTGQVVAEKFDEDSRGERTASVADSLAEGESTE